MAMTVGSRIGRSRASGVQPAAAQKASASTFTGSSTSAFVMAGIGLQITPKVTGNVLVNFSGFLTQTAVTINEGTILQIAFGTGTPPANNATATGTLVGEPTQYTTAIALTTAADLRAPIALQSLITGLTLGITYWIDIQVKAVTGTSVVVTNNPVLTAIELGSGATLPTTTTSANPPTTQSLTSGSGATYTTPTGARWIEVFMVGGGGGGGGASTTATTVVGSNGTNSIFNSVNAAGGTGATGTTSPQAGGIGGTGGSGSATRRQPGGPGGGSFSTGTLLLAGFGGTSYFGGGAVGLNANANAAGNSAAANTGAGGGGATNNTNPTVCGGGGAGEFVYLLIPNPAATYTYTVGGSGAGGTSTDNGGNGGSGFIFVVEHYS